VKDDRAANAPTLLSRRDLMTRSGWALLGGAGLVAAGGVGRLLFPRVRFEPPSTRCWAGPRTSRWAR
jgi:hypothetical protein